MGHGGTAAIVLMLGRTGTLVSLYSQTWGKTRQIYPNLLINVSHLSYKERS